MRFRYNYKRKPRQTTHVKRALRMASRVNTRPARRSFGAAKKTAGKAFLFIAITAVLLFGALWMKKNLIEAERFKIKKITATGFVNVSEKEFIEKLPVAYGDNVILSYAIGITRKMKKECPAIKSLRVNRDISGKIDIQITERNPIAWRYSETGAPEGVDCENVCFRLKPGARFIPELNINPQDGTLRMRAVALLNDLIGKKEKLYWEITKLYNVGEEFFMVLRDSSEIKWGRYDGEDIGSKLSLLYDVIKDAGTRFGGFEYIELQIADEGRVSIMPRQDTKIKGRKGAIIGGNKHGKT